MSSNAKHENCNSIYKWIKSFFFIETDELDFWWIKKKKGSMSHLRLKFELAKKILD